jgi:hypothetical protein
VFWLYLASTRGIQSQRKLYVAVDTYNVKYEARISAGNYNQILVQKLIKTDV